MQARRLFAVRSIAAIVPDKDSAGEHDAVIAAIEYGIKHLQVHDIVVMGHSNCGGIHGLLNPERIRSEEFISRWVSLALPAVRRIDHENPGIDSRMRCRLCEEGAVLLSIENLLSYDWVHEPVQAGRCVCTPFTMTLDALVLPCGIAKRKILKRCRLCIHSCFEVVENCKNT